jgi:hypothetical protein
MFDVGRSVCSTFNLFDVQPVVTKRHSPLSDLSTDCGWLFKNVCRLYVEVKEKFVWMRTKFYLIHLVFNLVFNPFLDNIFGKNIPFQ